MLRVGPVERLCHTRAGGPDHARVVAQRAPEADFDVVLRSVGVEHAGHVVLDVTGREQHARNGEDAFRAAVAQAVESVADDRPGEFEKPVVQGPFEAAAQFLREHAELGNRALVAAAVAAKHDSGVVHVMVSPGGFPARVVASAGRHDAPAARLPGAANPG